MKDLVINGSLNLIKKQCPDYNEESLEIIEYGLTGLYLTVSKTIIIVLIALILGVLKELLIFTVIYNVIRMPSFGLHATKSWICLVTSTTIFIGLSYLCTIITTPIWLKIVLGVTGILLIFKNSPADTEKRPIVNPKRRLVYKIISTGLAILFVVASLIISNDFVSNCFIYALILQCFMTAPTIYKLFNLPYDNYKKYVP